MGFLTSWLVDFEEDTPDRVKVCSMGRLTYSDTRRAAHSIFKSRSNRNT